MKKILSLLSVLTISGTAVPTTIAASPYQKEETIKNIDINQQTNNLENLSRIKRQDTQWKKSELCTKPTLATFTAGGAAAGASLGSVVPGAGTIIGTLVGGAVGIGTGLWAGNNLCPSVPKNK